MQYIEEFVVSTEKNAVLSITDSVRESIKNSGIGNGVVFVESKDPATGIVRLPEKSVLSRQDLVNEIRRLVPARADLICKESAEAAAGYVKGAIFGTSVSAIIKDGEICAEEMGIFLMDYDGPGNRRCGILILGE